MKRFSFPFAYKPKLDLKNTIIYSSIFKNTLMNYFKNSYKCIEIDPSLIVENTNSVLSYILGDRNISFDSKHNNNICCVNSTQDNYLVTLGQLFKNENLIMYAPLIKRDATQTNLDSVFSWIIDIELSMPINLTNDYLAKMVCNIFDAIFKIANGKELRSIYKTSKTTFNIKDVNIVLLQQIEDQYPVLSLQQGFEHYCSQYDFVIVKENNQKTKSGNRISSFIPTANDGRLSTGLYVFDKRNTKPIQLINIVKRPEGALAKKQVGFENPFDLVNGIYDKKIYNVVNQYNISISINISNLLFYFLDKVHLAEVVKSVWPDEFKSFIKTEKIDIL